MTIPNWLKGHVDEKGLERIRAAVMKAERETSAEIVPMIVRESTQTGHVEPLIFFATLALWWGLAPYLAVWLSKPELPYFVFEAAALPLAAVAALGLGRFSSVRRFCTTRADRVSSAMLRAQLEFYELGIRSTENRTGVLIFVSFLEHGVSVLADEAIARRLPAETWDELVSGLTARIRKGDFAGGMVGAIEDCGQRLKEIFPRSPDDQDELPNRLVIED